MPASRYVLYPIPWYSFLIVVGAALAIFLASREEKRAGLEKDTIVDLSLWLLPCGILGARLYYVAFAWDTFRGNPISILYIWEGGLAIYGGVIAGFITVLVFARKRGIPPMALCDVIAPGLALAQGIGRWGNFFNMEAYGLPMPDYALCFFPLAVLIPEGNVQVWHMATFFYESVWDVGVFIALMILRRGHFRRRGDVFLFYLFLYSAGRLVIEEFRMDSLYAAEGLRVSQLLSLALCAAVFTGILRRRLQEDDRRPGRGAAIASAALFYPATLAFIAYALRLWGQGLRVIPRGAMLGTFCLAAIGCLFLTYGKSRPEEVLYAHHRD